MSALMDKVKCQIVGRFKVRVRRGLVVVKVKDKVLVRLMNGSQCKVLKRTDVQTLRYM